MSAGAGKARLNVGAVRDSFAPWTDPGAEPLVRFEGVTKRFGDVVAVDRIDLAIYEREFFALLGPSGCGKTTLMRLLAGFETPDEGKVILAGVDLADTPPHQRPVNMMFQSYALFPHLSVFDNVAFGLKRAGVKAPEIKTRVEQLLALVKLEAMARRMPHQLSGGQRQRVALARSLVLRPKVLLLDEPLAALDKKLRDETQFELMDLQVELGMTFLIVTHDQDEAMHVSDRIAVMDAGRIAQVGPPHVVYEAPANRYVAEFVGDINLFEAKVVDPGPPLASLAIAEPGVTLEVRDEDCPPAGSSVFLAVRPEKMRIGFERPAGVNVLAGEVWDIGYTGDWTNYLVEIAPGRIVRAARANAERIVERPIGREDKVFLSFAPDAGVVLAS